MGERPSAPTLLYPPISEDVYDGLLAEVLYGLYEVDESLPVSVQVNGTFGAGERLERVVAESATVPNYQVRGEIPILCNTASNMNSGIWIQVENTTSSSYQLTLDCQGTSDLSAFPLVSYGTITGYDPSSDWFAMTNLGELLFISPLYNFTGLVNETTGTVVGWNETVFQQPSIVVSQVGWLVYNCQTSMMYRLPWYGEVFHEFPRLFSTVSDFQYPGAADFENYVIGLACTALPFIVIGVFILILGPCASFTHSIFKCVSNCCKRRNRPSSSFRHRCTHFCCCFCIFLCPRSKSQAQSAIRSNETVFSGNPNVSGPSNITTDSNTQDSEEHSRLVTESSNQTERGKYHHSDSRKTREKAMQYRAEILDLKNKFEVVLKPTSITVRVVLAFFLLGSAVIIPIGFVTDAIFSRSVLDMFSASTFLVSRFTAGQDAAERNQEILRLIQVSCAGNLSNSSLTLLSKQEEYMNSLATVLDPSNVLIVQLQDWQALNLGRSIAWLIVLVLLAFVITFAVFSLFLTFCTCKWGKNRVVCTRMSFHLGRGLRPTLLTFCFLTWLVLGALCVLLSGVSDFCILPSMVQVNTTVANYLSPAIAQIEAGIYNFDQTYLRNLRTRFNVAGFLMSCSYSATLFNPYNWISLRANADRVELLKSPDAEVLPLCVEDKAILTAYVSSGFYNDTLSETSCFALTNGFSDPVYQFCAGSSVLSLFVFFVALIFFNVLALFISRSYRDLMPNIYRIHLAREYAQKIQNEQDSLQELLKNSNFAVYTKTNSHEALLL